MSLKRIPYHVVLLCAFGMIAIGLAAAIVKSTTAALGQATATIAYGSAEIDGIDSLANTNRVLAGLIAYRAALVRAQPRAGHSARSVPPPTPIGASIARVAERLSPELSRDEDVAGNLAALRKRWLLVAARDSVSAQDLSLTIALVQPLWGSIFGTSGLSNDPSIDGINFGDALDRFPLSLATASEAASVATLNLTARTGDLHDRFAAARLLAQAQMSLDVGAQDASDELSIDPRGAAPLMRDVAPNVRAFDALKRRVTTIYVETAMPPRDWRSDRKLAAQLDTFTASSFAVISQLRRSLTDVIRARIRQARQRHAYLIGGTLGAISLELVLMSGLAWFTIVSYRNGRRRMAAERLALAAQRAGLEVQLTHAKAQQALLNAKAQFRTVFDRAPTGMIIVDRQCKILDINEAANLMLQGEDEASRAAGVVADHAPAIEQIFSGTTDLYSQEREYVDETNPSRWFDVSISPVRDEQGVALFAILMIRDITDGKLLEAQLVFEAGHDALTGLPNRKRFLALLQQALDERKLHASPGVFSVVFIDFNDFKTINDSFGHQAGDKFLVDGAGRLRDSVRATDIVARIGGDEFAILLYGADRWDIEKNVKRLQSVVSKPVNIEGQLVASSASFGIAQAELSYSLAAEIIRDADTAMYQAKAQGGRNYVVFDAGMREQVVRRMQLSIDIVHALKHHELELLYQPIVDLQDGKIAGCEALLRWRRKDGTLILPGEFMPLAEENGSIVEIGHWVTATACEQMRSWNELESAGQLGGLRRDFVIHVNLSVPEVHHVDLLTDLERTLMRSQVARHQIILEITEGIVLKNTPHMRSTLEALTAAGFRLCIDDFGTGYSSLRYLNDLPLHSFKIDRSFVSNGSAALANKSIVEMLMVLSRSLGLSVVAEGIETREQWEKLRGYGCQFGQGYLFAPALDSETLTALLARDVPIPLGVQAPPAEALSA